MELEEYNNSSSINSIIGRREMELIIFKVIYPRLEPISNVSYYSLLKKKSTSRC